MARKKDYSKERMALYDKFVEVFNETDGEMPGDEILSLSRTSRVLQWRMCHGWRGLTRRGCCSLSLTCW